MGKNFYVTTPIYYPSGKLHIGHTYTTALADILARYKKEMNYNVYFLTGSDEHGLKIQQKAEQEGVTPQEFVDNIILNFKELWNLLKIDYNQFIRTTNESHKKSVQKIFTTLYEKDLIYPSKYEGPYCVSCEEFLTFEQMNEDGRHVVCGNEPTIMAEDTYMLRVSNFKDFLIDFFATDTVYPEPRKKEILNSFILNDLTDLSVTRVSFDWGIKTNEDEKHIIYVWIDALSNYITALGYGTNDDSLLKQFWSEDTEIVQLVGKEITRFHSIYWPVILNGLGLRLPNKLLSHGWILNRDTKMSKSIGNVIDPIEIIKEKGADALRFYIANNLPMDRDGNFTDDLFKESFNSHLANNIGNLISRTSNMIIKYFNGSLKSVFDVESKIYKRAIETVEEYKEAMDSYNISEAMTLVLKLGQDCNKLIEDTKPWELEKNNKIQELEVFLSTIREIILVITYLLKPVLVENYEKMVNQLALKESEVSFETILSNKLKYDKIVSKEIIFERWK